MVAQLDAMCLGLRPRQGLLIEHKAVGIVGRPVARDRRLLRFEVMVMIRVSIVGSGLDVLG